MLVLNEVSPPVGAPHANSSFVGCCQIYTIYWYLVMFVCTFAMGLLNSNGFKHTDNFTNYRSFSIYNGILFYFVLLLLIFFVEW